MLVSQGMYFVGYIYPKSRSTTFRKSRIATTASIKSDVRVSIRWLDCAKDGHAFIGMFILNFLRCSVEWFIYISLIYILS